MNSKIMLSLATVVLFAAAAEATTVETTKEWFTVDAASVSTTTNAWGSVKPTRELETTVLDVDTDAANPAKYTPAESRPSATRYRVTGSMEVTLNASVPAADVFGETVPKAALVAVAGDPNKWYAWYTNDVSAAWVPMSGVDAPAEDTTYTITIEFTSTTVSYKVNGTQLVTAGESPSSTLDTVGGTSIASVGLAGFGSFGDFSAVGYEEFEVAINTSDSTFVSKYDLKYNDELITGSSTPAEVKAALDEVGANGYPKWQSIVLGLKDSASQPYLVPVQNADPGTLSIALGGVTPMEGYTVTYAVEEVATPTSDMPASPSYGTPTSVTLNSTSVKYYRLKVKITK